MKKAQSLIEYILILILISLIAITTLHVLGKRMSLGHTNDEYNSQQNIIETMTNYCKLKGLTYNQVTESCEASK